VVIFDLFLDPLEHEINYNFHVITYYHIIIIIVITVVIVTDMKLIYNVLLLQD
jgi:hypothetical protein